MVGPSICGGGRGDGSRGVRLTAAACGMRTRHANPAPGRLKPRAGSIKPAEAGSPSRCRIRISRGLSAHAHRRGCTPAPYHRAAHPPRDICLTNLPIGCTINPP